MAMVGYARVSTLDQDHSIQLDRLRAAGCTKIFAEKASGTSKVGRSALADCLEWVRDGDVLVITKIDRLARSAKDLHNLVADLERREIALKTLDQAVDTSTSHGKAFLGMLAVFAEFETNLRKERQLEGIAKAKAEGAYKGRKPLAKDVATKVAAMVAEGAEKKTIAKTLGISVRSVYNIIASN